MQPGWVTSFSTQLPAQEGLLQPAAAKPHDEATEPRLNRGPWP